MAKPPAKFCRVCSAPRAGATNWPPGQAKCRSCFNARQNELQRDKYPTLRVHLVARAKVRWGSGGAAMRARHAEIAAESRRRHAGTHAHNQATRRARLKGAPGAHTEAEWHARVEEFGHACAYCLRVGLKLTREHIAPLSKGGTDAIENVIPACGWCNSRKGARGILAMVGA